MRIKIAIFLSLIFVAVTNIHAQTKSFENDAAMANDLIRQGNYAEALRHYQNSFSLGNNNLLDYYNAACCAAMTEKKKEAFKFLRKSISLGYLDRTWAANDSDLASLRADKGWNTVNVEFDKLEKRITGMFSRISLIENTDLVPFKKNGLWGYLDKKTMSIVVAPEFNELGFMGSCAELRYRDQCKIRMSNQGKILKIEYPEQDREGMVAIDMVSDDPGPFPKRGIKGFQMNSNNEITVFSDEYDRYQPSFFNISGPFLINGKYYAVAHKADKSGVIDQEGNPLPNFDFVHPELVPNRAATGEHPWFYFTDEDGKAGFINELGETKLTGELIGYPFLSTDRLDYNIQSDGKSWGILNTKTLEWVLKPQPLKITAIECSFEGDCNQWMEKKDIAEFYFLIENGTSSYYIDRNQKAYLPNR